MSKVVDLQNIYTSEGRRDRDGKHKGGEMKGTGGEEVQ